jgi:hypothetical protein
MMGEASVRHYLVGGVPVRLQDDLLNHLDHEGWAVIRRKREQDWWYHEIWVLESRWSPQGFTLFLSFLTDPQPGNPNPFWLIGTSSKPPENRSEAHGEPSLMVTPNWGNDLPQFVADLSSLRRAAADQSQSGRDS